MSTENLGGDYPDILTTHDYDGIQEYDNPMPFWWKAIFVVTVIWSGFYVVGIEMGFINTYGDTLAAEEEVILAIREKQKQDLPPVDEKVLLAAVGVDAQIAEGEKVYTATCASCHGQKGEGLIGPNLTDKFWLHGGDIASIHNIVVNGVAEKGMPPWGAVIGRDGAINVTAYIHARLRGTNVAGKEPQGEPYGEGAEDGADAPAEADSGEAGEAPAAAEGADAAPSDAPREEPAAAEGDQ